jgi:hypothetical protein
VQVASATLLCREAACRPFQPDLAALLLCCCHPSHFLPLLHAVNNQGWRLFIALSACSLAQCSLGVCIAPHTHKHCSVTHQSREACELRTPALALWSCHLVTLPSACRNVAVCVASVTPFRIPDTLHKRVNLHASECLVWRVAPLGPRFWLDCIAFQHQRCVQAW